jgi:hypothetical protein
MCIDIQQQQCINILSRISDRNHFLTPKCHVLGTVVTSDNGLWIWWSDLLALLYKYSQLLQFTINLDRQGQFSYCLSFYDWLQKVKVKAEVTLRLVVYRQSVRPSITSLETHDQIFFQLNSCGNGPYVTSSLTREWVCHLQSLQVLASAVILRSDSRGTHDYNLLSQFRDFPNLEGWSSYLYPPGTG